MSNDPILQAIANNKAKGHADRIALKLQSIARHVETELGKLKIPGDKDRPVFCVLALVGGAVQYVGNGTHDEVKQLMASTLAKWQEPPEQPR